MENYREYYINIKLSDLCRLNDSYETALQEAIKESFKRQDDVVSNQAYVNASIFLDRVDIEINNMNETKIYNAFFKVQFEH